jgi:hypothetical protein
MFQLLFKILEMVYEEMLLGCLLGTSVQSTRDLTEPIDGWVTKLDLN